MVNETYFIMEETKKKPSGNRNRIAGHNFERTAMNHFRSIGFEHVITTRNGSRALDAQGIDLMHYDEHLNGRFPYNVQCKNYAKGLKYWDLLNNLPKIKGIINVVFHKLTMKKETKSGPVFHPVGHYAVLSMEDFLELAKKAKAYDAANRC